MGRLIDICGEPIDTERIKGFHLYTRDYLYTPCYQEVSEQKFSLFSRLGDPKKKFEFGGQQPFGCVLGEKEKPSLGGYEIRSFGESAGRFALQSVTEAVGKAGAVAANFLRLDTSVAQTYTILTTGRRIATMRLGDIPVKVQLLSGEITDVYRNDEIYKFLGEPAKPTFARVKSLVLDLDKKHLVFFGNGIDLSNEQCEVIYRALLDAHNDREERKAKFALPTLNVSMPKLNVPRLDMPSIKVQSPFVLQKKAEKPSSEAKNDEDELDF